MVHEGIKQANRQEKGPLKNVVEGGKILFDETQVEVLRERTKELIDRVVEHNYSTVVFNDRAARPISWMFRAAWKKYAGDRPLPAILFVNIGREKGSLLAWKNSYEDPRKIQIDDYDDEEDLEYKIEEEEKLKKAEGAFWFKPENKDIAEKLKQSVRGNKILFVDDFSQSGFSLDLARNYLEKNLPGVEVNTHRFLEEHKGDANVFKRTAKDGAGWQGTYLPWNENKFYTLLGEDKDPSLISATAEMDKEKRKRGVALKKQLEAIFD